MGEYRLSRQAREQLREIARFSVRRFGIYQAEAYNSGLERTFGLLSDFPRMGVDASDLIPGLRRFRFQSHQIFYSEDNNAILIQALIHVAQNVRRELFE